MPNPPSQFAEPVTVPVAGGTVSAHVTGGIGRIEFHHPKGNSLPGALLRELAATITRVSAEPGVRVMLLKSGGQGAFCAGASFDELVRVETPEQGQEFFSGFSRVILSMIRAPQFVVTRVHGRAAGGAVGLIAASELSFAVSGATAKLSELNVGIGPFVVGPVIEKKIGLAAFSAMAANADWRDAAWAERQGLYSFVFESASAMDDAIEAELQKLAGYNPEAMSQLKRVFWAGTESWDQLLAERAAMSGTLVLSEFTREAIAGFNK
jgi:methylglutaconyl-CoA hydratase